MEKPMKNIFFTVVTLASLVSTAHAANTRLPQAFWGEWCKPLGWDELFSRECPSHDKEDGHELATTWIEVGSNGFDNVGRLIHCEVKSAKKARHIYRIDTACIKVDEPIGHAFVIAYRHGDKLRWDIQWSKSTTN
jgi:hypothetical protein